MNIGKRIKIFWDWHSFCLFGKLAIRGSQAEKTTGSFGVTWHMGKNKSSIRRYLPPEEEFLEDLGFDRYQVGPIAIAIRTKKGVYV